jgi:hypothetical protein
VSFRNEDNQREVQETFKVEIFLFDKTKATSTSPNRFRWFAAVFLPKDSTTAELLRKIEGATSCGPLTRFPPTVPAMGTFQRFKIREATDKNRCDLSQPVKEYLRLRESTKLYFKSLPLGVGSRVRYLPTGVCGEMIAMDDGAIGFAAKGAGHVLRCADALEEFELMREWEA